MVELDRKLTVLLEGEYEPTDDSERLALARLCLQPYKQLNVRSCRLYAEAFSHDTKLANDMVTLHRYNAACAAVLAGAGQGKDAGKLTDQECTDLRKQGLEWLRADLAAWGKQLDKGGDKARPVVQGKMTHWKQDTDLTGVRDPKALQKLPQDERDAWQKLWKDVDALLAKTLEKK